MTMLWRGEVEHNYRIISPLRFETADYRMFTDPYGPYHSGAVGKIYSWDRGPYGLEFHGQETYVGRMEPDMGEGEVYPVDFVRRTPEFIEVRVDFSGSRLWDRDKRDGQTVRLYQWREGG
jgi:hypothetical protein